MHPFDNTSLGKCIPWKVLHLDDTPPLNGTSIGRYVHGVSRYTDYNWSTHRTLMCDATYRAGSVMPSLRIVSPGYMGIGES
jgi:hypothetical protein